MLIWNKKKISIVCTNDKFVTFKSMWGCYTLPVSKYFLFTYLNSNDKTKLNLSSQKNLLRYDVHLNRIFKVYFREVLIGVTFRWFSVLEIKGYGFKKFFDKVNFLFKLDLGFSHIIKYNASFMLFYARRLYGKRYLLVSSLYKNLVQNFVYNLFRIRPYLRYKFKGYILINEKLRLKKGKKKQFF